MPPLPLTPGAASSLAETGRTPKPSGPLSRAFQGSAGVKVVRFQTASSARTPQRATERPRPASFVEDGRGYPFFMGAETSFVSRASERVSCAPEFARSAPPADRRAVHQQSASCRHDRRALDRWDRSQRLPLRPLGRPKSVPPRLAT